MELHIKQTAIIKIKSGIPKNVVATELGVHLATVEHWWKDWQNDEERKTKPSAIVPTAQTRLKTPFEELLNRAIWLWYQENLDSGRAYSEPDIMIQAMHFKRHFQDDIDFWPDHDWLARWMQSYRVVGFRTQLTSAEIEQMHNLFRVKFKETIDKCQPEQIFVCDRINLNTLQMPAVPQQGFNEHPATSHKERLTVMACANASGMLQLPLVVVGKDPVPEGPEEVTLRSTYYKHQMSAHLTESLFKEWFRNEFYQRVMKYLTALMLPPRAVLLVYNCMLVPHTLDRKNVQVLFIPPFMTHTLQPFASSWMCRLKLEYKKQFQNFMTNNFNVGLNINESLAKLTTKQVINWLTIIWETTRQENLINVWRPIWPDVRVPFHLSEIAPVAPEYTDNEIIRKFYETLRKFPEYSELNYADVEKWLLPSTRLTVDECLNDLELVQVINEEDAINKGEVLIAQCEAEKAKQEAENMWEEAIMQRDISPKVQTISPLTVQHVISVPLPELAPIPSHFGTLKCRLSLNGGGILEDFTASYEKPNISLEEAREALEKVIEYCTKSAYYTKEQCFALIDLRERMRAEAAKP